MARSRSGHKCSNMEIISGLRQTLEEMDFERGIWYAAQTGDADRVEELLQNGTFVDKEDFAGYRALHYAARNGHYRVCETLLQYGADVDIRTRCGCATALHRAAMRGHAHVVELLLHHGADPNITDADGNTALHRGLAASATAVCELLIPCTNLNLTDHFGRSVEQLVAENCSELLPLIALYSSKDVSTKEPEKKED